MLDIKSQKNRAQAFTTSITPFDKNGALDEAALRKHLRRFADAGIGAFMGTGGSGEGYSLSASETRRLLEISVEELKGKVPVRAMGVEPRSAAEMIEFVKMAQATGIEAIQIYSLDVGHGHAPTPEELEAYFNEVLNASDAPMVLSTHQSVGYKLPIEMMARLVETYEHVIGINCSHQDLEYLRGLIDAVGERVDVMVGGPMQAVICFAFGGHGFLCSEGNLAPRLAVSLIKYYQASDLDGMMEAFGKIARLSGALYGNGGIRVTKAVLNELGLPGGYPRKPRLLVTDERLTRAMSVVRELNLEELRT